MVAPTIFLKSRFHCTKNILEFMTRPIVLLKTSAAESEGRLPKNFGIGNYVRLPSISNFNTLKTHGEKWMIPQMNGLLVLLRWSKKRLSDISSKTGKSVFFVFLGCFWAYVSQSHDDIDWATSMSFASINFNNPGTDPWIFYKK